MILMRVRQDNRIDGIVRDERVIGECEWPIERGMQAGIENEPLPGEVENVGVCADFDRAGQVGKSKWPHGFRKGRTIRGE